MTLPTPHVAPQQDFTTLAALELDSIAVGIEALDAMVKEAPIRVLVAQPSSPGKYLCLFTGEVDEVARSLGRGIEIGQDAVCDDILLPAPHADLGDAVSRRKEGSLQTTHPTETLPALGILETRGAPSLLGAADTAVKTGQTHIESVHLLGGIGGKATAILCGDVESVRVATEAGAAFAASRSRLVRHVVIPRPHPDVHPFVAGRRPWNSQ